MSEGDVVQRTQWPATVTSLQTDLAALGVRPGMVLLVHSSLSAIGWVCGEAVTVIQALIEAVGPRGTIVMPTQTGSLTDPKDWQNPPVPDSWKAIIRAETPAFDPLRTPTREMGRIAETFRTWPHVVRSAHPHTSFAAWGANAQRIVKEHGLDSSLGEGSPLARIYDLDGWILLLGVGFDNNTSLHLAEYRATCPGKRYENNGAPILVNGRRQWVVTRDLALDADDFPRIGEQMMAETRIVQSGNVGAGTARLMPQRAAVDYAVTWMETHRAGGSNGG
jgi:aminoglycoside 3-N-acetyltransferase